MADLPVIVIGAGPQGLAAAAHLTERGIPVRVIERGATAAAAVSEWGHIRLFSAWNELVDASARRLLEANGWRAPISGYPTGAEWVSDYLAPLAAALKERVSYSTNVTGVARRGRDKVVDAGRRDEPFVVHAQQADGTEVRWEARAVIDASGTWDTPNPAGADGYSAIGEAVETDHFSYRIPSDVAQWAGHHVVVVGAGHSAAHTIHRLAELVRAGSGARVTWVLRRGAATHVFGGGEADELAERAALGARARAAVDAGDVDLVTGFRVAEVRGEVAGLAVIADDGREITGVDHVIALTGFRPDFAILREMRLAVDPTLDAVAGIADEIDPNIHSCGSVAATGARELAHPEPGFFIVGAKSYGRAPTFLALTGYEQVRSVVAHLAGDYEAAGRNELVLPDTGVCGGAGEFDSGVSCCAAPAPALVQLGARPVTSVQ